MAASRSAATCPIPEVAPVMMTTFPCMASLVMLTVVAVAGLPVLIPLARLLAKRVQAQGARRFWTRGSRAILCAEAIGSRYVLAEDSPPPGRRHGRYHPSS